MPQKITFGNTYNFGKLTFLILKEKQSYTGVCLEFDLIVNAPTPEEAREHIEDLASGWLENVKKNKLSENLLNKRAPEKYWKIAEQKEKEIEAVKVARSAHKLIPQRETSSSQLFFSIVQKYFDTNSLA